MTQIFQFVLGEKTLRALKKEFTLQQYAVDEYVVKEDYCKLA